MEYLNSALFGVRRARGLSLSTQDVFQILLRSFHAAHCLILEEEAMLTTLTAAVVLPTCDESGETELQTTLALLYFSFREIHTFVHPSVLGSY